MATPAKKPGGGLITARSKGSVILPPCILAPFSNLVEPDNYEGTLNFKARGHFNEEQLAALVGKLQKFGVEEVWPLFLKEAEKAGKTFADGSKPDAQEWVDEHLKAAHERSRNQSPMLEFKNGAEYKDKTTGAMIRKTMTASDKNGRLLDIATILPAHNKMAGAGSIIQFIVTPGIFVNALIKTPQLSLKLQGIRVLKLERFEGNAPPPTTDDELVGLGDDFQADDDLSSFVSSNNAAEGKAPRERTQRHADFDLDDEIPF